MIKTIIVNFKNVHTSRDVVFILSNTFKFAYPGYTDEGINWASFNDSFRSLDTESKTFINYPDRDKITGIHLILENYKALNNIDPEDKKHFEEILEDKTHKENRYDDLDFSYELINV